MKWKLIDQLQNRVRRRQRFTPGPPAWQRVESGPLADLHFFLPRDPRPRGWVARILRGDYERQRLEELVEIASGGGTLYDIGGHVGLFTCAWLRHGGDRVEVFEPMPESARRIEETLVRNGHEEAARVHHLALADFDGEATLIQNTTDIGLASMSYLEGSAGTAKMQRQTTNSEVVVEVRCLDGLVEATGLPVPRFLKIDVEGSEEKVVRGATRLLSGHRPGVFCEMHSIESAVSTTGRLVELGYMPAPFKGQESGLPMFRFDPH